MPHYICMLRGVNVGGKNKIKMSELKTLFEDMGFDDVRTYIQSGNVMFTTSMRDKLKLSKSIESKIAKKFGVNSAVFIRTKAELGKILKNNPFKDFSKVHVTFLQKKVDKKAFEQLGEISSGDDELQAGGDIVYVYCPDGYGRTKLTNTFLEKKLDVLATTRNFKTVQTLYDQSSD